MWPGSGVGLELIGDCTTRPRGYSRSVWLAMPTSQRDKSSRPSYSKTYSKSRKSSSGAAQSTKQSKINDYFPPLTPLSWSSSANEIGPVPLNEEQSAVLEMAVNRGENVFFTGAAGVSF